MTNQSESGSGISGLYQVRLPSLFRTKSLSLQAVAFAGMEAERFISYCFFVLILEHSSPQPVVIVKNLGYTKSAFAFPSSIGAYNINEGY